MNTGYEKKRLSTSPKGYKIASAFCRDVGPYGRAAIFVREQTDNMQLLIDVKPFSQVGNFGSRGSFYGWMQHFICFFVPHTSVESYVNFIVESLIQ